MMTTRFYQVIVSSVFFLTGVSFLPVYGQATYIYAPQYYSPVYAQGGNAHYCGGIVLRPNEWSPWDHVQTRCGVELYARYNMKKKMGRRVRTTTQFRYVNTKPCTFAVTLSDVQFRLLDGAVVPWEGESVVLGHYGAVEGIPFAVVGDSQLCTFTKRFHVRAR